MHDKLQMQSLTIENIELPFGIKTRIAAMKKLLNIKIQIQLRPHL